MATDEVVQRERRWSAVEISLDRLEEAVEDRDRTAAMVSTTQIINELEMMRE